MSYKDKVIKYNKCAYFILPLLGLNTKSYGENSLIEVYLTENREIILQLEIPELTDIKVKENHIRTWKEDVYTWMSYSLPEKFNNEFDAFISGKYSHFSIDAYNLVRESINIEEINISIEELNKTNNIAKINLFYIKKMHDALHPIIFRLKFKDITTELVPTYLGAIAPKGMSQRNALRSALSIDFNMDIPEDAELHERPNLEKEMYKIESTERKKIIISREQFDMLSPINLFGCFVKEKDAIITVVFKDKNNKSFEFYFSENDKINDIRHLGYKIRKMINYRINTEEFTAVCNVNPWNIKIRVDKDDYYILDSVSDDFASDNFKID